MQGQAWELILRRIPTQYHEGITLSTVNGSEIVVQTFIRVEEEFIILRGRPAGTSDAGKIIILPFHQINYLAFQKKLTEPEVMGIFGDMDTNFAALQGMATAEGDASSALVEEMPGGMNGVTEEEVVPPSVKSGQPSKSILLAKLRARLAGDSSKPPPPRR
jgi:hypothetical protein